MASSVGWWLPQQLLVSPLDSVTQNQTLALSIGIQSLVVKRYLQNEQHGFLEQKTAPHSFTSAEFMSNKNDIGRTGESKLPRLPRMPTLGHLAMALIFGGSIGFIKTLLSALPPDFNVRWNQFFEDHQNRQYVQYKRKEGSTIYDVHGEVIATVGNVHDPSISPAHESHVTTASDIPAFMWQAVVACEDRRFFEHHGIDPRGIARAALSLTLNGGGSTITQQLARNAFLTNERKWIRKLLETLIALVLERRMSKLEILHAYLQKIYWGHGIYGIDAAADFYFGKPPSLLTVGECAMLAGLVPAPELFTPLRDSSRGKKAQGRALRRMVEAGFLDTSYAEAILNEPLKLIKNQSTSGAPFFVDEVIAEMRERYGSAKIFEGGLQIYTTLDLRMQEEAERIVQEELSRYDNQRIMFAERDLQKIQEKLNRLQKASEDTTEGFCSISPEKEHILQLSHGHILEELRQATEARLQASVVAMDPLSGAVRVLVGGRDYSQDSFNRTTKAYRTPGPTFSPVIYLAALAEGLNQQDMLAIAAGKIEPNQNKDAVAQEQLLDFNNEPIVRLAYTIGFDKVRKMASLLGMNPPLPSGQSLSIGTFKVTAMELATVYNTIAAGGIYWKPHLITEVKTRDGTVVEKHQDDGTQVVAQQPILELHNLLHAVVRSHKGWNFGGKNFAGKTGTSDDHSDVWFAGFNPDVSCVVWIGYDKNCPVGGLHPGTGASHAAPVWLRFMRSISEGQDKSREHKKATRKLQRIQKLKFGWWKPVATRRQIRVKDIWNWEHANGFWEEKEKMTEWIEKHLEKTAEIRALRNTFLQKFQILVKLKHRKVH